MKFTVEQGALTDGVNWVSRSLSTRPIKTELLGIVIDATGDEVILSGSDLETSMDALSAIFLESVDSLVLTALLNLPALTIVTGMFKQNWTQGVTKANTLKEVTLN